MRGRKPIPTVLKLLRGNPGKRAINRREPRPGPLTAEVPAELTDEVARAEWTRTIVPAIATGQITAADRGVAILHCRLWADWWGMLAEAATIGNHIIHTSLKKYPIPNPARGMANTTLGYLLKVDMELGLSPVSRSRVTSAKSDASAEDEKLDKILAVE
jgi:P27 family predicted phage terminase small subunit